MLRNTILTVALAATLAAIGAYAQGPPAAPSPHASAQAQQHSATMGGMKDGMMGTGMSGGQASTAPRQKMMEAMNKEDAGLTRLVGEMNSAAGARKTEAMARVITELVNEQRRCHQAMMSMEPEMGHRMTSMASGKAPGMDESARTCPMGRSAGTSKPGAAKAQKPDHAAHHQGTSE